PGAALRRQTELGATRHRHSPLISEAPLSEDQVRQVASIDYRDPVVALLLGLFFGALGVDRFYNGDTGLALGKLFTFGGLGIWAIVDLFLIMNAVKRKNLEKLNAALGMASPNP
ncbi:MAG: TM2 domain-containing protein, partial [Acidimicrobiia bacterium]|nr:TM2 domain-containing protein [Acidimicrobiia bacterium]